VSRYTHLVVLLGLLSALLMACTVSNPIEQPTTPPIIIVATPAADAATATSEGAPGPTAAPQVIATLGPGSGAGEAEPTAEAEPTDLPAATTVAQEATAPAAPDETAAAPASNGVITVAFDAFPSYFPIIVADVRRLMAQRGYELQLVPFALDGQNDFSEPERFARLQSGEWDVLATTLDGFARRSDPSIGAITALIDESAGADKLVARAEVGTINDLRGRRIAYSEGSVGEFFLYYALNLAGLGAGDVTLLPTATVGEAVEAYTSGQADAVSAWEPDVLAAEEQGGGILIASDKLRAILDVLVTSRNALTNKTEGAQAFHDAWFEALKLTIDNPDQAEQAILEWGNSDWTGIAGPGDLNASLEKLAQANLGANQLAFRTPDLLISRIREAQGVWRSAGQAPPEADLAQLVDGRFVLAAAQRPELAATRPPVNSSFLLTAQVDLPQLSEQEQQAADEIVQLPLEKIDFEPDSQRLTPQAAQDLAEQVLPVLRSSRLYLRIEGSSAWPGPEGRFTAQEIRDFALSRANSVATFLVQQGLSPNRLIVSAIDPKFPNSFVEEELAQDRIVRFTLVTPQGR
jgi:NitT/TauT family transport system substrate-binding protein